MKKSIMTVLFAVSMSVVANAANYNWGNYGVTHEDSDGNDFAGGTALLYVLAGDASTAVTFADGAWNLNGATLVATAAYSDGWGNDSWTENEAVSSAGDQYFSIIITEKAGVTAIDSYEGKYVIMTDQGSQEVVEPSTPTYGSQFMTFNDIAATDWQTASVPEPTSGLLLLLGMAGLALKRKIA